MRKKVKKTGEIFRHYLSLIIISAFVLLPYYWMVVTAVKPTEEVMVSPATLLPSRISLDNFSRVWQSIPLGSYMRNSFVVSVAVTAVSVVLPLCADTASADISGEGHRKSPLC